MQTFLPYEDFKLTAKCLDNKRLGKQRVEAYQILMILLGYGRITKTGKIAWENHPAVKMWKTHEVYLWKYLCSICEEWKSKNYKDTVQNKSYQLIREGWKKVGTKRPDWLGNKNFHDSHKSNLLRKNPSHYEQFNWKVPNDLSYVWPK